MTPITVTPSLVLVARAVDDVIAAHINRHTVPGSWTWEVSFGTLIIRHDVKYDARFPEMDDAGIVEE